MASEATATKTTAKRTSTGEPATDIERQIARLRSDIAGLGEAVANYGSAKAGQYRASAAGTAENISAQTREALDAAKAELARIESRFEGSIRANPLQAVGIAVAAGFLAALIMRR